MKSSLQENLIPVRYDILHCSKISFMYFFRVGWGRGGGVEDEDEGMFLYNSGVLKKTAPLYNKRKKKIRKKRIQTFHKSTYSQPSNFYYM